MGKVSKKDEVVRLRCCGHVMRRGEDYVERRATKMEIHEGLREEGLREESDGWIKWGMVSDSSDCDAWSVKYIPLGP